MTSVVSLLDINVLVALLIPEHQHHAPAVEWFATEGTRLVGRRVQ